MTDKEKPLPKPPSSPFGRKRQPERSQEDVPLMADQIAMAQAEGRLEEFLEKELPGNEHARKLVSMMMGMTGMDRGESLQQPTRKEEPCADAKPETPTAPPEDVVDAVRGGDVQALMGLLDRERRKRSGDEEAASGSAVAQGSRPAEKSSVEKETVDRLMDIARDNDVSVDWLILRALRVYVREYGKTGRL